MAYVVPGTPCLAAGAPPAGSVAPYVASASPFTNTAASLKYKWVRITLKQNGTFPNALVDSTQAAASQVCWNSASAQEVVSTALGYANCAAAQTAGLLLMPMMLGIMSFNLPAGLSLYWAAGQLIGIVQQAVMNRASLGREMRAMMEKRARKKEK